MNIRSGEKIIKDRATLNKLSKKYYFEYDKKHLYLINTINENEIEKRLKGTGYGLRYVDGSFNPYIVEIKEPSMSNLNSVLSSTKEAGLEDLANKIEKVTSGIKIETVGDLINELKKFDSSTQLRISTKGKRYSSINEIKKIKGSIEKNLEDGDYIVIDTY